MVFSASMVKALEAGKPASDFFTDQLLFVIVGSVVAAVLWRVNYRTWVGPALWVIWAVAVGLILATAVMGTDNYGAKRWLYIGSVGVQPSEFCKIAFLLVAVRLLLDYRSGMVEFRASMVRVLIFLIVPIAIMYRTQSDLGTTVICAVGIIAVMWMGGVPRKVIAAVLAVCVVGGLIAIFGTGYRAGRLVFLDPWNDGKGGYGTGYNIIRSYYALSEGGLFGVGLGNSHEKFQYLFASESDFIFAVIGEELGLVGAMAVVLLCITLGMFIVQKYYLEAKTAATLTGKASRGRMLIADRSVTIPLTILCSLATLFVIMMYACVPIGALFPTWGYKFTPLTFKWFGQVFTRYHGLQAFRDSFVLSLIASPITALLSMIISYLVVKRKFRSKGFIEAVSMLAMAVPGTVLGVGYIRGFSGGLFHTGFLQGLYGSAAILIIVFVVRSLPTGTRSGISALRQIDKSIEESAYDMGADSFKVFMTVTLPLIKDSFLSGLVTAFVRSITAISAIILLVTPQFLLITVQINEFAEKGSYSIACAFATILIIITYGAVLLMNLFIKFFGTSRKIKEDSHV